MALVVLFLGIGFFGLNVVAVYKIITKAGYSGTWTLLVLAPFVAYLIGLVVLANDVRSRSFQAHSFAVWFGLAGFLLFVEYIFFLVFAFSDWPALRQRGQSYPPGYGYGPPGPPPLSATGSGTPLSATGSGTPPVGAWSPPTPGRPMAGPLTPGRPMASPAGRGGWPQTQGGGWSDWDRPGDQPSVPGGPRSPTAGESEGVAYP
jgi:hypothetical protein